ncbi:Hypothetical_protein [Hexamita inflata]|uniref:Hypothetical_protein n=1 Tax=Hexamita inflata TaxID=28002 RepID=A0AA86U101_9EUKA|nr:Hypothetical protein HINF_LOCUS23759 [Hexamita inflata]
MLSTYLNPQLAMANKYTTIFKISPDQLMQMQLQYNQMLLQRKQIEPEQMLKNCTKSRKRANIQRRKSTLRQTTSYHNIQFTDQIQQALKNIYNKNIIGYRRTAPYYFHLTKPSSLMLIQFFLTN